MSLAGTGPRRGGPARGRPRSEAVERAIVEGVMKLLEDGVPLAELSIERIARTAGVGKAAIYRRWTGKEQLFVDVMRAAEPPTRSCPAPPCATTWWSCWSRCGCAAWRPHLRDPAQRPRPDEVQPPPVGRLPRHRHPAAPPGGLDVLRRGRDNGELRADVDLELLNDMVVGPVLVRTVLRPDAELPADLAERVVDTLLQGLRPS